MQFGNPLSGDLIIGNVTIDGGSLDNLGTVGSVGSLTSLGGITNPIATYGYGQALVAQSVSGSNSYSFNFTIAAGLRFLAILIYSPSFTNTLGWTAEIVGNSTLADYYSSVGHNQHRLYDFAIVLPEVETNYSLALDSCNPADTFDVRVVAVADAPISVPVNDPFVTEDTSPLVVNQSAADTIVPVFTCNAGTTNTVYGPLTTDTQFRHFFITNPSGATILGNIFVAGVNICVWACAPGQMIDLPFDYFVPNGATVQVSNSGAAACYVGALYSTKT